MKTERVIITLLNTFIIAVTLAVIAPSGGSAQMAPEVKAHVEVTGDYVLLGDLFKNAGNAAKIEAFKSPAPGGSGTVNADRLVRVARNHGLDWNNPRNISQVQVSRAGLLITDGEIKDMIAATLDEQTTSQVADRGFDITFTSDQPPLYVPSDVAPTAEVVQLRYSKRTGQFTAVIAAPAGDPAARRHSYSGRAVEVSSIAVPIRNMRRGEVITEQDVEIRNVPVRKIDGTTLTEMSDLVGMAARQSLRTGKPIRVRDIEEPKIVRKNTTVTVQLKSRGLVLTVRGTALQSGAMGDTINIRNANSNRIIQGKVIAPELVQAVVGATRKLAQAN